MCAGHPRPPARRGQDQDRRGQCGERRRRCRRHPTDERARGCVGVGSSSSSIPRRTLLAYSNSAPIPTISTMTLQAMAKRRAAAEGLATATIPIALTIAPSALFAVMSSCRGDPLEAGHVERLANRAIPTISVAADTKAARAHRAPVRPSQIRRADVQSIDSSTKVLRALHPSSQDLTRPCTRLQARAIRLRLRSTRKSGRGETIPDQNTTSTKT